MSCQAQIQVGERKGQLCGKPTNDKYCKKHKRQAIIDKAKEENIRYCDITRNCFEILQGSQNKCATCLRKAQIRDRKREDKKRQDPNLCLDCACILKDDVRAVGKHDKKLRRCVPCYKKLLEVESKRPDRERHYKEEGFKNKHVIWNHYIKSAKKRSIDFKLTKEKFNLLIIEKCIYCGYFKEGEVNGIDRIDNSKGYQDGNVIPCCESCNVAKGSQHPQEFVDKLFSIYQYTKNLIVIDDRFVEEWKDTYLSKNTPKISNYQKSAKSRNIEFTLNIDNFNTITSKSCYLCGIATSDNNKNGIDRVNNNIAYLVDNCKACCGHCNILKKDLTYHKLLEISGKIYHNYEMLTNYFKAFDIKKRTSKVEARTKHNNPDEGKIEERAYKEVNEVIQPNKVPEEIQKLLENKEDIIEYKQWKVKQIYEVIQENNETLYRTYCEEHNDISKIEDWENVWTTFVLDVKGKTVKESESSIRNFVGNLRRIRHNELCVNSSNIIERKDRQHWPATSIVKAYLDNKLETFKKYTEEQTGDNQDDIHWQKRWELFVVSLNKNRENKDKLKSLCSKFLAAQRIKRYRNKST